MVGERLGGWSSSTLSLYIYLHLPQRPSQTVGLCTTVALFLYSGRIQILIRLALPSFGEQEYSMSF